MLWCLKYIRMIAVMYVSSADLILIQYAHEFSKVGSYTQVP